MTVDSARFHSSVCWTRRQFYLGLFSKMLGYLLFVLATITMALLCTGSILGPGLYNVEHIRQCEGGQDDYLFIFDIVMKKFNRTHDVFNPTFVLKENFDHSYSVNVDICKYVDGGCKLYLLLRDEDMIHFINEYARDNMIQFLKLAGVEPPQLPVPAGTIKAENFTFDYTEMPDTGLYGLYEAHTLIMDKNTTVVACIDLTVEFKSAHDKEIVLDEVFFK